MGPKVPNAPPYVGSMWKGVQDFGKPRRASNSSVSDECFDPFVKYVKIYFNIHSYSLLSI